MPGPAAHARRSAAQDASREGDQRLRALAAASGAVLYQVSADWSELQPLDGKGLVPSNDAPVRDWFERNVASCDQAVVRERIAECISTRTRFDMEHRTNRPDGSVGWTRSRAVPLLDEAGEITEWCGTAEDITERRTAEERTRTILESINDAFYAVDADFRFTYVNRRAERLWGRRREELIGRHYWTEFPKAVGSEPHRMHMKAMSERMPVQYETVSPLIGRWIDVSIYPEEHGGLSCYFRDVSDRKRAEAERERLLQAAEAARAEAERAGHMKDEFLATLSHELRTPLTAMLLWGRLLRSGMVHDEAGRAQAVEAIEASAEAQKRLIDDLLDVARMTSGKLVLSPREAELEPLVRAAIEAVRPTAEAKRIAVEVAFGQRVGRARFDADRIRQVVWNLLNNAVKFTDAGGAVRVRLRRLPDGRAEIQVQDTGRGINAEFLPHVFERFRQQDGSTTRAAGGLGLGLAIARQIVELHGGTIRADSDGPGTGATFTVEFPLPASAAPDEAAEGSGTAVARVERSADSLRGVRMLFVEDDAATRTAVVFLLTRVGAEVTAVESAAAAVGAFRAALGTRPYDVLISDIGLPERSGLDLIRDLREIEAQADGDGRLTPAIALTAYARQEDREQALAAGFHTHVPKPVEPAELLATVARLVRQGR